ncbi:MAG: ATP-dependent RNA helicase DbpA [Burkholderiaceae bacterium]
MDGVAPGSPFEALPLRAAMLANLRHNGYHALTPIQAAALPAALAGRDVLAQAATGSGKTAAFALPLLERLDPRRFAVQALVLCPTRELADQVAQEIRRLARARTNVKVTTLCGGTPMRPQMASLEHGAHVVVGTPGRVIDHLQRRSLSLHRLRTLVLDEADRMLDMGFHDDIAWIADGCPPERQTLLFSATYPPGITALAERFLRDPQIVRLESTPDARRITQRFVRVDEPQRWTTVARLLLRHRPVGTLVFCNTRHRCRELAAALHEHGIDALTLHGELEQRERDEVLIQFNHRSCPVLIATDVAARGLDIDALPAVINAELAADPDVHLHRIGRTGRAGQPGLALSLVGPRDTRRLTAIERLLGTPIACDEPPRSDDPHSEDSRPDDSQSDDSHLDAPRSAAPLPPDPRDDGPLQAPMVTLQLMGGRKDKIRPADIQGALTGELGLRREQIGRITIGDFDSYVAVDRAIADTALQRLNQGRVKGRPARARRLSPGSADDPSGS